MLFRSPQRLPEVKSHQEVGCPALAKHGYIFRKDVTTSAKIMDKFNTKFSCNIDQARVNKHATKRLSDYSLSDEISARHVHPPSISNTTIDSTVSPDSIYNVAFLTPNRAAPTPTYNGYNDIYSSESEDNPVFEEMVDSSPIIKTINTYTVIPPKLTLVSTSPNVLKKKRKIRGRTILTTIKQAQSDTTASARFLSTALHSVS